MVVLIFTTHLTDVDVPLPPRNSIDEAVQGLRDNIKKYLDEE